MLESEGLDHVGFIRTPEAKKVLLKRGRTYHRSVVSTLDGLPSYRMAVLTTKQKQEVAETRSKWLEAEDSPEGKRRKPNAVLFEENSSPCSQVESHIAR